MQYPLLAKAIAGIYNQSFLGTAGFCSAEQLHGQIMEVGMDEQIMQSAEDQLAANPELVTQVEQHCSCGDPQVEIALAAWCKFVGLE